MHAKTALAVAWSVLAVPSAALAAAPDDDALHPSRKLTHDPRLEHRLVREHVRLAPRSNVRRLRTLPVSVLRERNHVLRKRAARNAPAASPVLEAIAACESGGNPSAIGGGGTYRGKYQFDYGTWSSVGGSGDPAAAPEAEQDKRAAMLYSRTGASSWPVCGR